MPAEISTLVIRVSFFPLFLVAYLGLSDYDPGRERMLAAAGRRPAYLIGNNRARLWNKSLSTTYQ